MLETASARLSQRGEAHFGSPDKLPEVRLDAIDRAGRLAIPYTSGILIGIGETRRERVEALIALRDLHERHGHLQEMIVQNFRAKPGTKMADAPEPTLDDHLWTIAVARLLMPRDVSVQAPPNLAHDEFPRLLEAGIDDFGGVSPVTPDHVNPEAPWPERALLARPLPRPTARSRRGCASTRASCATPSAGSQRACAAPRSRPPTATAWHATRAPGSPARARSRRPPGSAAGARSSRGRSRRRSCARSSAASEAPT